VPDPFQSLRHRACIITPLFTPIWPITTPLYPPPERALEKRLFCFRFRQIFLSYVRLGFFLFFPPIGDAVIAGGLLVNPGAGTMRTEPLVFAFRRTDLPWCFVLVTRLLPFFLLHLFSTDQGHDLSDDADTNRA